MRALRVGGGGGAAGAQGRPAIVLDDERASGECAQARCSPLLVNNAAGPNPLWLVLDSDSFVPCV